MRAFVTGGTGFLGGRLIEKLLGGDEKARREPGYEPRGLAAGLATLVE